MKKWLVRILLIVAFLLLSGAMAAGLYLKGRVAPNPPGTIGNTGGNLNNMGYFCESDGLVYFANAYDHGSIYSMTPDEQNLRKLVGTTASLILAGQEHLYYFQSGSGGNTGLGGVLQIHAFNRCRKNGKEAQGITRDYVHGAQLVDDHLFLLVTGPNTQELIRIGTDRKDQTLLAAYTLMPSSAAEGYIYFNGNQTDHSLYRMEAATGSTSQVADISMWYPTLDGDWIYFLDLEAEYGISRFNLRSGERELLVEDRVDAFNVGNGYIYYQTAHTVQEAPALKFISTEGGEATTLSEGTYTAINMTSRYVYFQEYGQTDICYRTGYGQTSFGPFTAARDAAAKAQ